MNNLKVSIEDIKQGIERYYNKDWLFKLVQGSHWEDGFKSTRIIIDNIEINIFETTSVIRLGLWYSRTSHVDTYVGHVDAVDIEINRLFERLYNETNYMYEREQQVSSKTYNS